MRIPLDYYRILGLPIQATAEQLKQSHRDRTLQVPRREYSELAIDARRQLIDKAYDVLGNGVRRSEYDQDFLAASKSTGGFASNGNEAEANVPTIEVENDQIVGALLILLELGEYELVLRLGRPYLKRDPNTQEGKQLKEQPALPDIILTLAVACLELGREEWQQNHYEHAAESLETGRELLLKEDLFPVLRAEIQSDLYKLRPYRCLELVARPLEHQQARQEGLNLLRGMLQDRGGIDGAEDDLSGLGVDDFLRFVQQLRGYLTAAEQQEIFEAEAQRPSAVGTYLAVYALLARGFAQHQPALVRRAKQMLLRLSGRQDVHLEQAVCAMLLGQTEEASHALELSQEYEPLNFIREHSQGSPDLLPGLCLYAENWLQQEVFPFFRDLDQEPATLKDYFADSTVQSYLERLPLASEPSQVQESDRPASWSSRQSITSAGQSASGTDRQSIGAANGVAAMANRPSASVGSPGTATLGNQALTGAASSTANFGTDKIKDSYGGSAGVDPPRSGDRSGAAGIATGALGTAAGAIGAAAAGNKSSGSLAEKISRLSPTGKLGSPKSDALSERRASSASNAGLRERRSRRGTASPKWDRLALVMLAGLICVGLAFYLARMLFRSFGTSTSAGPALVGEPLDISLNESPIEIAGSASGEATAEVAADDAEGIAQATIEQWLQTKQAAYSSEQETDGLSNVLTGSLLDETLSRLQSAEDNDWYADYSHGEVTILSVSPEDATEADSLIAEAEITESATIFESGERSSASYTDDVNVFKYEIIRDGDSWLITDIRD